MKKEVFNEMMKEMKYIGLLFLLLLIIFKIVFFKESLIILFRNVLSLFWLFVLPGYFMMFYWEKNLDFIERLIIGTALGIAIMGILSYYIGLAGLNIRYHTFVLPPILILVGILINFRK